MKTISKVVSRSVLTLAVAGLGLVLTPRTASADFITFNVNEGAVTGANAVTILNAWKLNGGYTETLTVTAGTFTADAFATFTGYFNSTGGNCGIGGNCGPFASQISASSAAPNLYEIVATMHATGTVQTLNGTTCLAAVCFFGSSGTASLYLDPFYLGAGAVLPANLLLSSSTLLPGSGGQTDLQTLPSTGNFNLNFGNIALTGLGSAYFPTLANLLFTATVNGDFDAIATAGTQNLQGDVSAQFSSVIPEPATLTLLGLGLAGAAARRRKGLPVSTV
jgi:hypothetical protein